MKEKLSIKDISKIYNKRNIIKSINLELSQGEIVALLGPNGAGKTTSFNIIAGLIKPDLGSIYLNDKNITKLPIYLRAKLGINYLPQDPSIFRGLTVENNIKAILELNYNDKNLIDRRTEELLEDFSILHLAKSNASNLSGGERRRLEIARTIAMSPKFIMMDEPLAAIDPLIVYDVKKCIKDLKTRNIGVLITDHNVRDVLDIIDRAYIIYDGKILKSGNAKDIIASEDVRSVYLGKNFRI